MLPSELGELQGGVALLFRHSLACDLHTRIREPLIQATLNTSSNRAPLIALHGIRKQYPAVLAVDDVSLSIRAGEIHAVLGENGAGKSTLMKIIYGAVRPDTGHIEWNGQPVHIASPGAARELGIAMVFQHFALFESVTVVENMALALAGEYNLKKLAARITEISQRYGLPLNPWRPVHELSVGERQRVEIVRCLLQSPKLLILDEPTSVLTPQAAETERRLAELMIGREFPETQRKAHAAGEVVLELIGLSAPGDGPFGTALDNIALKVRAGEIIGIAGISGNGQAELLAAISGENPLTYGQTIWMSGVPIGTLGPTARRRMGMTYVPEERLGRGAVPPMSLTDNALLTGYRQGMVRQGLIQSLITGKYAADCISEFDVRSGGPGAAAQSLSGGNLQNYIVGREIRQSPKLMIVAQPTWGVDVAASALIRQRIIDLAARGVAVLVISEDLGEILEMCDSVAVIAGGRLSPLRKVSETNAQEIGQWMAGLFPKAGADRTATAEVVQ